MDRWDSTNAASADPVAPERLQSGDPARVGAYRLVGRLGSGGMGEVFLGQSPGGRLVAVKLIYPYLAADPDFRARFASEVAAARRVSSMFTVPVVDADPSGARPWLVTAYVTGPSLADAVADYGPLPVASVLALAAGLAEGLGAVHTAGLVHRDLKPSNVRLASDGPRIIDFGISRAMADAAVTGPGIVVGTPWFMSPEQATGDVVGSASDVFSLGSVLVFAATGEGPFGTGDVMPVLHRVVYSQPAISGVPEQVRRIVERCLIKDPRLRPTTEQILAEVGTQRPAAGWLPADISTVHRRHALPRPEPPTITAEVKVAVKPGNIAGHAFISYVREDSRQVDQLQQMLETAGVPVWRDTADLWPGEDWRTKIRRAITDNALVFIACFSWASLARGKSYQNEELTLAIEQLRLRRPDDPWLIPVRFDECDIPDRDIGGGRTLTSIQRADLFGDRASEGADRLVAAILRILGTATAGSDA